MNHFMYIHGFNSGENSRSAHLLSAMLGREVVRLVYDSAASFPDILSSLHQQIEQHTHSERDGVCLLGTSLGGFFALQLAHPAIAHVVAFNPVVHPVIQLQPLLGENTNFSSGMHWTFSKETLLSYAAAGDPRPHAQPRDVVLGTRDELLDYALAEAYWRDAACITLADEAHQIADFGPFVPLLRKHVLPETFGADWKTGGAASAQEQALLAAFGNDNAVAVFAPFPQNSDTETLDRYLRLSALPFLRVTLEEGGSAAWIVAFPQARRACYEQFFGSLARRCGLSSVLLLFADGQTCRWTVATQDKQFDQQTWSTQPRTGLRDVIDPFLRDLCPKWSLQTVGEPVCPAPHGNVGAAQLANRFQTLLKTSPNPVQDWEDGRCRD